MNIRKFVSVIVLFCCLLSISATNREYVIVIHGGAGNTSRLEKNSVQKELYYAALDSALQIGNAMLAGGANGTETVLAVVRYLENNPLFNAGKGATCTMEGTFELDAALMTGKDLKTGTVAGVKYIKNPIDAAFAVMTESPHVMLTGKGADLFAREKGIEMVDDNLYFATPRTMEWVEQVKKESKKNGTVGCVVLDREGNLTAGTSTGGMFKKQWGRVGDTPVVGAGNYADNNSCAISCTGHGEYFIRHVVAYDVCARYKYLSESLEQAANHVVFEVLNAEAGNGGLIAVDKDGNIAMPFNSEGMFRGYLYKEKETDITVSEVGIGHEMMKRH